MTPECRRRAIRNEHVFASANEQAGRHAERLGHAPGSRRELLCECSDPDCNQRVWLSLDEWRRVHRHPRRFVIVRGHVNPEVEGVVERNERFAVVEKREDPDG